MAQTKAGEQMEDPNLQKHPVLSIPWILRISPEAVKLALGRKKQITGGKERDRRMDGWSDSQAAHVGIHLGCRGMGLHLGVQPGQGYIFLCMPRELRSVGPPSDPLQPLYTLLLSQLRSAGREAKVGFLRCNQGHW